MTHTLSETQTQTQTENHTQVMRPGCYVCFSVMSPFVSFLYDYFVLILGLDLPMCLQVSMFFFSNCCADLFIVAEFAKKYWEIETALQL